MLTPSHRRALLAGIALALPGLGEAQDVAKSADPAVAPPPLAKPVAGKRVFVPGDFARFAPKTAYDMLVQVPGFTVRQPDQERGLGQASENVLVNGQRVANKSGGAIDQLQRVSASSVERIELVEAASLGIAGLSGEVANVIVRISRKATGQFEWRPEFRAHFARPNWFRGSASYSGKAGPVDYTLSVKDDAGRGAYGGTIRIFNAQRVGTELRREIYHGESDLVTIQGKFALDGPGSSLGNLTLAYTPYWNPYTLRDRRIRTDGDNRRRNTDARLDGYYIDLSGGYEFALGSGRLKMIGLRHFDHEPVVTTQVTRFDSGAAANGVRFGRDSRIGETVARAEYGWKAGSNGWQVSLERAYNSLDQRGALALLSPAGTFEDTPFPEGTGKVVETRYEGIATWSRPLGPNVDVQVAGGGEISKLARVDGNVPPRKFFRPKGSATLGWRPAKGWDASLKLRRRVGQISFYDFLAQPNLQEDRENSGNPDLVPPQSWELEGEVGRDLGRWGKARVTLYAHRIEDIVDIIPVGEDGEAIGNLPRARRWGVTSATTLLGDPIGWTGAKLDLKLTIDRTRVRDPLTGEQRSISGNNDLSGSAELRYDIPHSNIAWGAKASTSYNAKSYYLTEINRSWEGPLFLSLYVEHKNVLGMTARVTVSNLLNARHRFDRTVFNGRRSRDPVAFIQANNQLIGPIIGFSLRGTF